MHMRVRVKHTKIMTHHYHIYHHMYYQGKEIHVPDTIETISILKSFIETQYLLLNQT